MRNTETVSVSLPLNELREMERTARKENRTMSELVRELYRRYLSDEARREFGRVLETLRAEVAGKPASKLTMRQIDKEIAAARRSRTRRTER